MEGTIKNGQSRDTDNTKHKSQTEDKQSKNKQKAKKMSNTEPTRKLGVQTGAR